MAEESIKIPIKISSDKSAQLATKLQETEIQEKLPASIKILENCFKTLVTTKKEATLRDLSHLLDRLNKIAQNPSKQTSAYLISLAQALSDINKFDMLDDTSQANILKVMGEQMAKLEELNKPLEELNKSSQKKRKADSDLFFAGRRITFSGTEFTVTQSTDTQDAIVPKDITISVLEDELILEEIIKNIENVSDLYMTEYNRLYSFVYMKCISFTLCDSAHRTLIETYDLYAQSPDDFSGLLPTILEDVKLFKEKCSKHFKDEKKTERVRADLLAKELSIFYQQMKRRHLQIKICTLYNSIFCDNTFQSTEKDWKNAYGPIFILLNDFKNIPTSSLLQLNKKLDQKVPLTDIEKREFISLNKALENVEILIANFNELSSLEINAGSPLLLEKTGQCIIELNNILVKAKINDFAFNIFDRVFETIKELQEKIKSIFDNDINSKNDNFSAPRMRMTWNKPSLNLQKDRSASVVYEGTSYVQNAIPNTLDPMEIVTSDGNIYALAAKNNVAQNNIFVPFYGNTLVNHMFSPSPRISASESLDQIAKAYDLKRLNVKAKGDCMYLASAAALKQIKFKMGDFDFANLSLDDGAKELRGMVCAHLAANRRFKKFVTKVKKENTNVSNKQDSILKDDEYNVDKNYDEYLQKLLEGDWGDHCQLFAICDMLPLKIVVFNSDDAANPIILGQEDAAHIICLGYEAQKSSKSQKSEGWHYQAFLRLDNNAIDPPQKVLDFIKTRENKTDYIRKTPYS